MTKGYFAPVFLTLFLTASLHAQLATTTSLVGTVSDSSGKSIPKAKVTAVEAGTLDTHTTMTTDQGYYVIEFVRVGDYNITVFPTQHAFTVGPPRQVISDPRRAQIGVEYTF